MKNHRKRAFFSHLSPDRIRQGAVCTLVCTLSLVTTFSRVSAQTLTSNGGSIFYIDMENHNFTQPGGSNSTIGQLLGNPAAPYQNSLITPGNPNAAQVSYASNYYNVLAGTGASIHPSEPNYIWQEGGSNFGVTNDNTPYGTGGNNISNQDHLSSLLQNNGILWKSYQEDIDLATSGGKVTSTVLPQNQWTVPLNNISGTSSSYTNPYNGSNQYNFAAKHDGQLFFTDTNGGNDTTNLNPEVSHYAPLQQLATDLTNNNVGKYNLITPDQFNDSHTALTNGFTYNGVHYTGDQAEIAQGDNFLSQIIPLIQASNAYKNNGAIVIWWDETEPTSANDTNTNDFTHTLEEIVISPLAKGNGYNSTVTYTHSSDLRTLQEVFNVTTGTGSGFLNDAANANDLSDLFVAGAIPQTSVAVPFEFSAEQGLLLGGSAFIVLRILKKKLALKTIKG